MIVADALAWLNLLLVPVVGLQLRIVADLAGLKATQAAHAERLRNLERARA